MRKININTPTFQLTLGKVFTYYSNSVFHFSQFNSQHDLIGSLRRVNTEVGWGWYDKAQ